MSQGTEGFQLHPFTWEAGLTHTTFTGACCNLQHMGRDIPQDGYWPNHLLLLATISILNNHNLHTLAQYPPSRRIPDQETCHFETWKRPQRQQSSTQEQFRLPDWATEFSDRLWKVYLATTTQESISMVTSSKSYSRLRTSSTVGWRVPTPTSQGISLDWWQASQYSLNPDLASVSH